MSVHLNVTSYVPTYELSVAPFSLNTGQVKSAFKVPNRAGDINSNLGIIEDP